LLNDMISGKKPLFTKDAHTELRAQLNRRRNVTRVSGSLTSNTRSDISGISARVWKNGVAGFASMAEYSNDAADTVLREASGNALFMDSHIGKGARVLPHAGSGLRELDADIPDAEQKRYIDFTGELDAYIAKKYPGLAGRIVAARADSMEKRIVTSDGFDTHSVMPRSFVYLFLSAATAAGTPVELFAPLGGYGTFDRNFTDPALLFPEADALYEKLMQKREGVYPDAGVHTCVLGGILSGMLAHEAVGHTTEADLVLGGSVAGRCLNKQVASGLFSLTDFANSAFGKPVPLPLYVDDEGTPCEDALIIRDGILTGYMNNRETAQRFSMKPQGNARAYLFSDEPLIRMRNTAVLPGNDKLEDMIASVDDGYFLLDSGNGQADTTGEFMFGISMGYEIKNGKLGRAILDTTITGVAFEMLKTVDMVSRDMIWTCAGMCGKKQPMPVGMGGPALRCQVMIGGK
jgi:TldD protein